MKTHIDSYQFGRMVINEIEYKSDLLIIADTVCPYWRRKQGHSLSPEDLESVIAAAPSMLIVGCGAYGIMDIPDHTRQFLKDHNIELWASDTHKAVHKFNELGQSDASVAAAFHLTC
jgi:hypothetical protein